MPEELRPITHVARGATYMFIQGFLSSVIGLVYFMILANFFLPRQEMGKFHILSFTLLFAQMLSTFALPEAATKYIAQFLAEGNTERARAVIVCILRVCLIAASVSCLTIFISADWLSILAVGTCELALHFRVLGFASFFAVCFFYSLGLLRGLQKVREMAAVNLLFTVVQSSLAIFLFYMGFGLVSVVYGWLIGYTFSLAGSFFFASKYLGVSGKSYSLKQLLNFSHPLYISAVLGLVLNWVDQLFLLSKGLDLFGVYGLAVRAAIVPSLISNSIFIALFPKLSELYVRDGTRSLEDAFYSATRYATVAGFPIIIGLAVLAYPVMLLFGGSAYLEAAYPFVIICLAMLPTTVGVAIFSILFTLEKTVAASVIMVTSILSNTALCYLMLVPLNMGMFGAALARLGASLVSFGLGIYVLKGSMNVRFDTEMLWKTSLASSIMVGALLLFDVLRQTVTLSYGFLTFPIHLLPIYVIGSAIVYFLTLILLKAIKEHDIELVHEYLPKKMKWVTGWLKRFVSTK